MNKTTFNQTDTKPKLRESYYERTRKLMGNSQDNFRKSKKNFYNSGISKDFKREESYASKLLDKRRKMLQKNFSVQKLERTSNSKTKKNTSLHKRRYGQLLENSSLIPGNSKYPYPRITGKRKKSAKEQTSLFQNLIAGKRIAQMNQSQSSNVLTNLVTRKKNNKSSIVPNMKNTYSSTFYRSKV